LPVDTKLLKVQTSTN